MARQIVDTLIIYMLTLPMLATTVFAQTSMNPLFHRIYDGDYVWSLKFPSEEVRLVGYGYALFEELQKKCPNVISQSQIGEVGSFLSTVSGSNNYGVHNDFGAQMSAEFLQQLRLLGAQAAFRIDAEKDANILALDCSSAKANRVGQNVWRMLAGRRPAYLAQSARQSTILREDEVPINYRHYYDEIHGLLIGGTAARVFKSDVDEMNGYGVTVLECLYDEDPNDEFQERQYYWGHSLVAQLVYNISIIGGNFLLSKQQRMDREIGGAGRFIHPFTTYGSPRPECPSFLDPDLHHYQRPIPKTIEWPKGKCRPVGNGLFDCP